MSYADYRRTPLSPTSLLIPGSQLLIAAILALLLPVPAVALQVAVDRNGDGLLQPLSADPRVPGDVTTPAEPFIFWLNTDQDDLDYYETWPIDRADYATVGIDSLRDLEDFTRLAVRIDQELDPNASYTLRLTVDDPGDTTRDGIDDAFAINLYASADPSCGNAHLKDSESGALQRSEPWNQPHGKLGVGEPLELALDAPGRTDAGITFACFLIEGRHEGLGGVRATLLRGGRVVAASDPTWILIRHVKRLYQRVTIPWPEGRKDIFHYDETPPPLDLAWQYDPQGFAFEPPWYETDDVIVWVYGWLKSGPGLYEMSTVHGGETVFKRLWHRGYRGRLTMFHWPTVKRKVTLGLLRSEFRGYKTGPVLMDHVHSYPPGKRVHVTAHSLGGVPLMSALEHGMRADNALFQVSAIPAEVFDTNPELVLPDMREVVTPARPAEGGYHGLLSRSRTRIYNLYNASDVTFFGWNAAQKLLKGSAPWFRAYKYYPDAPEGERLVLKTGLFGSRLVTDPDEARAFITRARTHALGAEPRVRGLIDESYDLDRPPYSFGPGHVVAWSWNPQQTTTFYNLVLDLFNIRYNSETL